MNRERGFSLMSFIESIRTVLSKYATFDGRARRSEFWWYYLAVAIVEGVLYFALIVPGLTAYTTATMEYAMAGDPAAPIPAMPGSLTAGYLVVSVVALALLLPTLAVIVRRLHDTGKSGALAFLLLIPVVNFILIIVWGASTGTPGPNQFGPDPKAVEPAPAV
ncbi:DUF805 domain-containing protein [Promicromonospora sukumoe]|uniref:Uncharacterized membrane protein YhaH (DUF805 family) n=1 Tax=Promicromonospora sukumoe TaxID=88382 RepID=A0A7W3PEQ5_9MICO|nr:DUF805 domain-containing protein [Promicromonospora sukumoe]MBA8808827.1 uncharacterized membrane protein YhaH (DUF805 family) [Promicromonospora sukumoe]